LIVGIATGQMCRDVDPLVVEWVKAHPAERNVA
jgi:hypothetical protein